MKEETILKGINKEPDAPPFTVKDKRFRADTEKEEAPAEDKLPTYVEQLKKHAEESENKLKEYIAAYKKKMMENDEFRKRLEINSQKRAEQLNGEFILNLIPVVDNLERAITSAENGRDFDSLLQGIKITQNFFINQLKTCGVERIEVCGKTFKPEDEEAVEVVEVNSKDKDNIVIDELEKGYRFKDRLLRPAKVRVGKYITESQREV